MKTIAFTVVAFAAVVVAPMPCAAFQPAFRHLQQGNGRWVPPQNGFPNTNLWPQAGNVGGGWSNQGVGNVPQAAFPQTGAFVNGLQQAGGQQAEELEQSIVPTPATPTSPVTTDTPTAAGQDAAAQATIMVLLPDFLAPNFSGSGSTMVLAGESSNQDDKSASALPNNAAGETTTKSGAVTLLPAATATVFMLGVTIAGFF